MARKIFGYYITKNNPRELLWYIARQQDKIDQALSYIESNTYLSKKDLRIILKKEIGNYKEGRVN